MPRKVIPMSVLLTAAVTGGLPDPFNVAAFCRQQNITRQTFYKYRRRFQAEGLAGLEARSRAPKRSPRRTPLTVENLIVEIHKELAGEGHDAGAATIHYHLGRRLTGSDVGVPSETTIWRILDRRGFVTKTPAKHRRCRGDASRRPHRTSCGRAITATG
jgi:transposase-like protein